MMKKESILFLRSNPIAPDPRVEKEANSLVKFGFNVIILCWDRENKFPDYEKRHFGEIYRIKFKANFGTGIKNFRFFLRWQLSLFFWLLINRNKYTCIHACDFDTIIPAILCKILYKKKVVYDIFDFYADMLRNVPDIFKKIIKKIDLFLIRIADAVIIADESRLKQIEGSHPKRLVVIYNSPDSYSLPADKGNTETKGNQNNLVIGYVGLLQKERGLLEMINVVKRNKNWKLILGGFGGDEDLIKEQCKSIDNIVFVGRIPYEQTLRIYSSCDVLFATYDPKIPNHRYSSANKLFEAMMLGKPIIVAKNTGMDEKVRNYNLGFVVDYGEEAQLEGILKELESWNTNYRKDFAKRVSSIFEKSFSWAIMERKLICIYSELY